MRLGSYFAAASVALVILAGDSRTAASPKSVNDGHGDYVLVPGGSFRMGDTLGDGDVRERPAHVVELLFQVMSFVR